MRRNIEKLASLALAVFLLLAVLTGSVAAASLTVTGVTADRNAAAVGEEITWTAVTSGGIGTVQYNFYVCKDGALIKRSGYSTAKTYTYTPTEPGKYSVRVYGKDAEHTVYSPLDGIVYVGTTLSLTDVTADKATVTVGEEITWTANASGGTGTVLYNIYVYKDGALMKRSGYTASKSYTYTPTEPGKYTARAYGKDAVGPTYSPIGGTVTVSSASPLSVTGVTVDKTKAALGETVTWTADASGGTGTVLYNFYVYKDGAIIKKSGYKPSKSYTYTPTEPGKYTVRAYGKDSNGAVYSPIRGGCTVYAPLNVTSLEPYDTWGLVGSLTSWYAEAGGGYGALQYRFTLYRDGKNGSLIVEQVSGWQNEGYYNEYTMWPGRYTCKVEVKDQAGNMVSFTSSSYQDFGTAEDCSIVIESLLPNGTNLWSGDSVTWTATAHGGFPYNDLEYNFYIFENGKLKGRSGWQSDNSYWYTPTDIFITVTCKVYVRDKWIQQETYTSQTEVWIYGA